MSLNLSLKNNVFLFTALTLLFNAANSMVPSYGIPSSVQFGSANFESLFLFISSFLIDFIWAPILLLAALQGYIDSVTLLGYDGNIEFEQTGDQLSIELPKNISVDYALVFRIRHDGM